MTIHTDEHKIAEFLKRGVEIVLPSQESVAQTLASGKRLKVYYGIDPTGPSLHIGHAIAIKKIAQLQKMGHEVVFLIGDFTAQIGDPTDKLATRVTLTPEQIAENLKTYRQQASKIVDFDGENKATLVFNSSWLGEMKFKDVIELCAQTTIQRLLERDMFEKRLAEGKAVHAHEVLYPLMQGYDSVALMVDGEIGGNDQLFNMLMGRDLLKNHNKDKFVMTVKLLTDAQGKKMGKSEGNMVTLDDSADEMFGKIMSWTDGMIIGGFELCTNVSQDEILEMNIAMQQGENPMQYKKRLAREIISIYHNNVEAETAQANWEKTFSDGGIPETIPEITTTSNTLLMDALNDSGLVESKSDFRRLVKEGGVKIMTQHGEEKITDEKIIITETVIVKIGKKKFIKIVV